MIGLGVRYPSALPVLVALTAMLIIGHICALPTEGQPGAVAHHEATPSEDPHESDGIHGASCDATLSKSAPVRPSSPENASLVAIPSIAVATPVLAWDATPDRVLIPRRAPDRPLFLLNATFLI